MKNEQIVREFSHILQETQAGRAAALEREAEGRRYLRRFVPEDRLILLGGGHIALPLCKMAAMLDFAVTVVDDRPSFANHQRFPEAKQVICDGFENALRSLELRATDYVCIITRGHRWDGVCLRTVLRGTEPSYLGMIGSRRRTTAMLKMLEEEGFDPAALGRVHTPIGLEIGALTTAEIAVSICAELVQHRRSLPERTGEPCLEQTNTDPALLRFMAEGGEPAALMTVVGTSGSTPVDSGAIMAIDRAGRIYGTIGGGCGEAEVMRTARRLIGTGGRQTVEVDMSNDLAMEEGMVCGGRMLVLAEDVSAPDAKGEDKP
jgi:xanthine dehydrogenase accessory factor